MPPAARHGKQSSGEGVLRADIHTRSAFTALLFNRRSSRAEWRIGKNGHPPDPGAVIRGDQQAALPDPAQSCKVCCEFLGEYAADVIIIRPL